MSEPRPGQGQPGERPQTARPIAGHTPFPDASTDPGRAEPYESLYRGPADSPNRVHRTTSRHYEPSSVPPDEHPPGDTYHWLYRPDESQEPGDEPGPTGSDAEPGSAPPLAAEDQATRSHDGVRVLGDAPVSGLAAAEALEPAARAEAQIHPPDARPRRRPLVILLLVVLIGALAAGVLVVALDRAGPGAGTESVVAPPSAGSSSGGGSASPDGSTQSGAAPSSPSSPTEQSSASAPEVAPVRATAVEASCEARPSTDGGGRRVSYQPQLVADDDPSTAWRCEGAGTSETLTFSFPAGTRISELSLINGYTKVDPATKADRYEEYRRITEVRWTFPSGVSFTQSLDDGEESLQKLAIATQSTDQVQLTVTRSTSPGSRAQTRDAVLVSEVAFAGPAS